VPIGVTLLQLRRELRAEAGMSLNPAQGVQAQEALDITLDRQQRELWDAYQWPHLRFYSDFSLIKGQYLYDYPDDMPFEQVSRIHVAMGNNNAWKTLAYGIRAVDIPPSGIPRGTPSCWQHRVTVTNGVTQPEGQIALLPIPDGALESGEPGFGIIGTMRLEGQAPCTSLVDDDSKCIIDSKAIVLFSAAEVMATQKNEAAALKLTKAQNYLRRLLQNQGADKRASYNMGGNHRVDHLARRPYAAVAGIDYIP
jgi:hypothetical protein